MNANVIAMKFKHRSLFLIALLALAFCSCAHTRLPARALAPEVSRLSQLNQQPMLYALDCAPDDIVGHQYLLILFPFGRISLETPKIHLRNALEQAFALAGYNPQDTSKENADLIITCSDLSLSAYDYLFFRHIVATIELTIIKPKISTDTPLTVSTRVGAIKGFAFYQQLYHLWNQALEQSAESAVKVSTQ